MSLWVGQARLLPDPAAPPSASKNPTTRPTSSISSTSPQLPVSRREPAASSAPPSIAEPFGPLDLIRGPSGSEHRPQPSHPLWRKIHAASSSSPRRLPSQYPHPPPLLLHIAIHESPWCKSVAFFLHFISFHRPNPYNQSLSLLHPTSTYASLSLTHLLALRPRVSCTSATGANSAQANAS